MASISSSSELWVEIWKRLPAKTICRFRCVCKPWNSLLTSTFFIALHHKFSVSNTSAKERSYLLMPKCLQLQQFIVYQPRELQRNNGGVRERVTFLNLPYPTNPDASDLECVCFSVCGVVNGVVCLTSPCNIVLWNPTIHKHIYLWYDMPNNPSSVGMGFDAVKNDLKVVMIPLMGPWYYIFSVEEDCWRTKSLPDDTYYRSIGYGCFVNGTIYWLVTSGHGDLLLLFDCEREELRTMAVPPEVANGRWPSRWSLFNHGDRLSVLRVPTVDKGSLCEVWVMEEEAKFRGTWRKVLTMPNPFRAMFGVRENLLDPRNRIKLSSDDLPLRLAMFDHQPLSSQVFEKTLSLMNVKTHPSPPKQPLKCEQCYFMCRYIRPRNTLFQSRLL